MNDSVKVLLRGGLGNQLFQYAAGVELSSKLAVPLLLSRKLLPSEESHDASVSIWPEQISSFEHLGSFCNEAISSYSHFVNTRTAQLQRMIGDVFPKFMTNFGMFAYEQSPNADIFGNITRPVTINGYCSEPVFFRNSFHEVVSSIQKIRSPSDYYLATLDEIKAGKPVGVHVRLGDYSNLPGIYGFPRLEYMTNALRQLRIQFPENPIWVFSDEPKKAEGLLQNRLPADLFLTPPKGTSPLENLLLLSNCIGIIGTNSTFSWWASALNHSEKSTVLFPRPLYPSDKVQEPKNWLLPDWMQIGGA
jgi:hypothetical protein